MKSNKSIAQAFAAGATSGKSGNLYIEGTTIYSYGRHFPVARRNPDGTVWINPERYSVTTSRHQSLVRAALKAAGVPLETAASLIVETYSLAPGEVGEVLARSIIPYPTAKEALRACFDEIGKSAPCGTGRRILVRLKDGRKLPLDAAYTVVTGEQPRRSRSLRRCYPLL